MRVHPSILFGPRLLEDLVLGPSASACHLRRAGDLFLDMASRCREGNLENRPSTAVLGLWAASTIYHHDETARSVGRDVVYEWDSILGSILKVIGLREPDTGPGNASSFAASFDSSFTIPHLRDVALRHVECSWRDHWNLSYHHQFRAAQELGLLDEDIAREVVYHLLTRGSLEDENRLHLSRWWQSDSRHRQLRGLRPQKPTAPCADLADAVTATLNADIDRRLAAMHRVATAPEETSIPLLMAWMHDPFAEFAASASSLLGANARLRFSRA